MRRNRVEMDGSPQNGYVNETDVVVVGDGGSGARRRAGLALDLENPSGKRKRIASLSDLAYAAPAADAPPKGERGERAAPETPTPTQFLFPKNVTEEQEAYASGFELALKEIYSKKGLPTALASSTAEQEACNTVRSVPVDTIGTVSWNSSASTNASVPQEVPQMLFGEIPIGNARIAPCVDSSSNVNLNSNRSAMIKLPEAEALLQYASNICSITPDVRNASLDRCIYSLGRFEGLIPDVLPSSKPHLVTVDCIDRVRTPTGKTTAEHDARSWMSAGSSVGRIIPSCGVAVPLNPGLAGPGSSDQSGASHGTDIYAESFRKVLPVSSHAQTRIPAVFPARSNCGALPPVCTSPTGFHAYGNQRMRFPPGAANLRTSSVHLDTGLEIPVNQLWSGASSSSVEPVSCGLWMSAKGGGAPVGVVVDMNEQEQMKLERKRAKNRVAAQRCQTRKLERIARLEDKAERLREQNSRLLQTVGDLRTHVAQLKKQITLHADKGCRLMLPDVTTSINSIVSSL